MDLYSEQLRAPRLPAVLAAGVVLLTSLPAARANAAEPAPSTLVPYVVALDPGHGGSPSSNPDTWWDPGVVAGSLMEKDITLDLALRLRKLLESEKVHVVMTRTTDQYMSIADRWGTVHSSGARLFVSLHVNAFDGDPTINGTTVLYPKPESLPFAQALEAGLAQSLKRFGIVDDGVTIKPELWVKADIPTATIEPAYLTNPHEAQLLQQDDFRDAIASGVYQGILASDPEIEATRLRIVRAEAQQAAERQAASGPATAKAQDTAIRWALLVGGTMLLFLVARGARRSLRPQPARRRSPRRRRTRF